MTWNNCGMNIAMHGKYSQGNLKFVISIISCFYGHVKLLYLYLESHVNLFENITFSISVEVFGRLLVIVPVVSHQFEYLKQREETQ